MLLLSNKSIIIIVVNATCSTSFNIFKLFSLQARDKAETKEELESIYNDIENEEVKKQITGHYMELMNGFNSDANIEETSKVTKALRENGKNYNEKKEDNRDKEE